MHWQRLAGFVLSGAGVVGYAIGVYVPYTGRAFSITALMIGVALAAIGSPEAAEASELEATEADATEAEATEMETEVAK
ncbi:MAG: hypothetical protein ABEH81_06470 [Halopenitus sp.]